MFMKIFIIFIFLNLFYTNNARLPFCIEENKQCCALLDINADIIIDYDTTNGPSSVKLNLSETIDKQLGICSNQPSNNQVQFNISIPPSETLMFNFVNISDVVTLSKIAFVYNLPNKNFPNAKDKGAITAVTKPDLTLSRTNKYYECNSYIQFNLTNKVILNVYNVKAKVFSVFNNSFGGDKDECPMDFNNSTTQSSTKQITTIYSTDKTSTLISTPSVTSEISTIQSTKTLSTTTSESSSTTKTTNTPNTDKSSTATSITSATSKSSTTPSSDTTPTRHNTDTTTAGHSTDTTTAGHSIGSTTTGHSTGTTTTGHSIGSTTTGHSTDTTTTGHSTGTTTTGHSTDTTNNGHSTDITTSIASTTSGSTTAKTTQTSSSSVTTNPVTTPPSKKFLFRVTDSNGIICLLFQSNLIVKVSYKSKDSTENSKSFSIESNATHYGECSASTDTLNIQWLSGLWINFTFALKDSSSYLEKINVQYKSDPNYFPNDISPNLIIEETATSFDDKFKMSKEKSYLCQKAFNVKIGATSTLTFENFQYQAFRNSKNSEFASNISCENNPLVAIIVGVVLAVFLIIVVIIFLIFRCRANKHKGYEEI